MSFVDHTQIFSVKSILLCKSYLRSSANRADQCKYTYQKKRSHFILLFFLKLFLNNQNQFKGSEFNYFNTCKNRIMICSQGLNCIRLLFITFDKIVIHYQDRAMYQFWIVQYNPKIDARWTFAYRDRNQAFKNLLLHNSEEKGKFYCEPKLFSLHWTCYWGNSFILRICRNLLKRKM